MAVRRLRGAGPVAVVATATAAAAAFVDLYSGDLISLFG